jgi:hypothetical protein
MESRAFDTWIRDRAARTNRRRLLGLGLTASVATLLGHERIATAQFGGSGTCTYSIQLSSTVTPGAAATGTLTIEVDEDGAIESGSLELQGQAAAGVVGQATGHAIDLLASLGDGTTLSLTGLGPGPVQECAGPLQGMLANPSTGQLGVWIAESEGFTIPEGGNSSSSSSSGGIQSPAQPQPTSTPTTAPNDELELPTPTPTEETALDTDSDGLSDAEELSLGTDPNNQDSDMDGLSDGREVNAHGTNPLHTDSDSDGLTDALEIDHSANPNVPDTDGDGLGDAFEANSGFSEPSLADTDGDADDDLAEFSVGTDPRDPNCFSGPGSVCTN